MDNLINIIKPLLDALEEVILILDKSEDIIFVNKRAELLLGNTLPQINYLKKINRFSLKRSNKRNENEYNLRIMGKLVKLVGEKFSFDYNEDGFIVLIFKETELKEQKKFMSTTMEEYTLDYLIGNSDSLKDVIKQCEVLAINNNNLLVYGETGTGKEMFARYIHKNSINSSKPFINITCTGAHEDELEIEMFGDERNPEIISKISLAEKGVIFIDEISDLSMRLQGKLMSLIYRGEIEARIIATTNKDLKSLVEEGEFRENLFYALETFTLLVPPLRQRKDDIKPIANNFLKRYNHMEGKDVKLSKEVLDILVNYSWPGNIRELSNVISYIVSYVKGDVRVGLNELPSRLATKLTQPSPKNFNLEENEKRIIIEALNSYGHSKYSMKQIANELGISRATLYRKLDRYGIQQELSYKITDL